MLRSETHASQAIHKKLERQASLRAADIQLPQTNIQFERWGLQYVHKPFSYIPSLIRVVGQSGANAGVHSNAQGDWSECKCL